MGFTAVILKINPGVTNNGFVLLNVTASQVMDILSCQSRKSAGEINDISDDCVWACSRALILCMLTHWPGLLWHLMEWSQRWSHLCWFSRCLLWNPPVLLWMGLSWGSLKAWCVTYRCNTKLYLMNRGLHYSNNILIILFLISLIYFNIINIINSNFNIIHNKLVRKYFVEHENVFFPQQVLESVKLRPVIWL